MRIQDNVLRIVFVFLTAACAINCGDANREEGSAEGNSAPTFMAYETSYGPGADCSTFSLNYPQRELAFDRNVELLIEIDRLEGMSTSPLSVNLPTGVVNIESILMEVGISSRVVWSDELPASLFHDDVCLNDDHLIAVMQNFKNVTPGADEWAVYLVLIKQRQSDFEFSCVIDPETRSGAVVMIPEKPKHPGAVLHAIGHEIGHLLNLPHPWDYYGNTRSLMSYPWRWVDWDWNDPRGYFFDDVGRRHILRGPNLCVRPGISDARCEFLKAPIPFTNP